MNAKRNKRERKGSKKKSTKGRYWKEIGSVVTLICAMIVAIMLIVEYMENQPSWTISLKELHIVRYNDEELPEARFMFEIENFSSERHSISLESVEFVAVDRKFVFRSQGAKKSMEAHTIGDLDVRESSLFFDSMLAIPYNRETLKLNFVFSTEGETKQLYIDNRNVVKCMFMQEPRFDPFRLFEAQPTLIIVFYDNDVGTEYGFHASSQTSPFISLINTMTDSSAISFGEEVFFPTYGGICMFNIPGYPNWFDEMMPSDFFEDMNEFQISEAMQNDIDFDFGCTNEFVVAIFSETAEQDTLADKKILPIQIILTANPEGKKVTSLRDSLSTKGFRVIIEKGNLASILTRLTERYDGMTAFGNAKPDSVIRVVQHVNEALSHENALVLELGHEGDEFAAEIRNMITECGFGESYTLNIPTMRRYHPASKMVLTNIPRIIVFDVPDTLTIDSTKVDTTGVLYELVIQGPKDKFR